MIGGDNDTPALLKDAMQGAQILVHEATFTEDVIEKVGLKYQHSTARMVAEAAEAAGIDHIILTHFSGRYQRYPKPGQKSIEDIRTEAKDHYQGNVCLAEDWGCWQLNRNNELVRLDER